MKRVAAIRMPVVTKKAESAIGLVRGGHSRELVEVRHDAIGTTLEEADGTAVAWVRDEDGATYLFALGVWRYPTPAGLVAGVSSRFR